MNVLIEGRRGLGKTTIAEWKALQLNKHIIAFDPRQQFKDLRIQTADLEEVKTAIEDSDGENAEPLSLSFHISSLPPEGKDFDEHVEEQWNRFAKVISEYGDYVLIVDEAHRLQKPQYVNRWLEWFIRESPRRERDDESPVDLILTFHRPTDVHGIVLSQADELYIFRQFKRVDLEYLEKEFGEEVAQAVGKLRTPETDPAGRDVLHYIVAQETFEVITDDKSWYVNIRKPREDNHPGWGIERLEKMYGKN